jgi:hypothetical protein
MTSRIKLRFLLMMCFSTILMTISLLASSCSVLSAWNSPGKSTKLRRGIFGPCFSIFRTSSVKNLLLSSSLLDGGPCRLTGGGSATEDGGSTPSTADAFFTYVPKSSGLVRDSVNFRSSFFSSSVRESPGSIEILVRSSLSSADLRSMSFVGNLVQRLWKAKSSNGLQDRTLAHFLVAYHNQLWNLNIACDIT